MSKTTFIQESGTVSDGNTNSHRCQKSRAFFITSFTQDYVDFINSDDKLQYAAYCDDLTKDGKWHCHVILYYRNPRTWKAIKEFDPQAHVEKIHDMNNAIHYIIDNKNGKKSNIQEIGDRPIKHKFLTAYEISQFEEYEVPAHYYNTWLKWHKRHDHKKFNEWHKEVEVTYICGPSGSGKSKLVAALNDPNSEYDEVKHVNQFWDGATETCDIAVYDDFRDSHMCPSEFINFIDYNTHILNIKGDHVINKYKKIFITSIQRPEDLWLGARSRFETSKQWMRRMRVINLYKNTNDSSDISLDIESWN